MDKRFDIKGSRHAAEVADEFLSQPKLIAGHADWIEDREAELYRRTYVVTVDGIPTNATLEFAAYPILQEPNFYPFAITLNFPPCIARLEYVPAHKSHTNPLADFVDYDRVICGPHYHAWEDNRRFARPNELPKELEVARPLPSEVRTFQQALRWFCDRNNIIIEKHQYLELPPRGWLL